MSMSFPEIRQGNGRPHTDRVKARHGARRRRVASCLEVLEDRTLLATVDLSIVNTVLPAQVNPGGQLTYTIAATNNDATTDAAAGVTVSDTFTPAADAAFGTLTPPTGWTDVVTSNTVTFTERQSVRGGEHGRLHHPCHRRRGRRVRDRPGQHGVDHSRHRRHQLESKQHFHGHDAGRRRRGPDDHQRRPPRRSPSARRAPSRSRPPGCRHRH